MKKLHFLILLFVPYSIDAQHFFNAPTLKSPVKTIVEWVHTPGKSPDGLTIKKGFVYHFDQQGDPSSFKNHGDHLETTISFEYNPSKRLKNRKSAGKNGVKTISYIYLPDQTIQLKQEDGMITQSVNYFDENQQQIEVKTYKASPVFDINSQNLSSRKILNYNALDSIDSIMEYYYENNKIIRMEKLTHLYDLVSNKKTRTTDYDENGEPELIIDYQYNQQEQLVAVEYEWKKTNKSLIENFEYQGGLVRRHSKLDQTNDHEQIWIYEGNRLVRYKEIEKGKLRYYIDFQYEYYPLLYGVESAK